MSTRSAEETEKRSDKVAIVKKYANRRLYNTATSSYVTLDELSRMVREGENFLVYDAKSGEDITRSVLTQIILEEDGKGRNLLPIGFLRQLISYYDDSLQQVLPRYLEMSMESFTRQQDQMRSYLQGAFGPFFPAERFDDMTKQNMALFENAARMFNPFAAAAAAAASRDQSVEHAAGSPPRDDVSELKSQLAAMQRQIEEIGKKRG
ncbi:polyhydroxyalkanoate synthesis repressor PhaR [Geminicoccus roseus]|uniref:polyhydroxyalkanoate synthesis repressor PhaR n=1 Tax=Geminicoccus roseus TaxID=404900 RepID=UPI000418DD12|nr:polyhydroxyalkanoate synthesis repressor PhaR [Geminicoccus roseus]